MPPYREAWVILSPTYCSNCSRLSGPLCKLQTKHTDCIAKTLKRSGVFPVADLQAIPNCNLSNEDDKLAKKDLDELLQNNGLQQKVDDSTDHARHLTNDISSVTAKFAVNKNVNLLYQAKPQRFKYRTNWKKNFYRELLKADAMLIKNILDVDNSVSSIKALPQLIIKKDTTSDNNIPETNCDNNMTPETSDNNMMPVNIENEHIQQMPLLVVNGDPSAKITPSRNKLHSQVKQGRKFPRKELAKKVRGCNDNKSRKNISPPITFPKIDMKAFKIPRAAKLETHGTRGQLMGKIWQNVMSTDRTGQWYMVEETRHRVGHNHDRLLIEYESWLRRLSRGDFAQWGSLRNNRKRLGCVNRKVKIVSPPTNTMAYDAPLPVVVENDPDTKIKEEVLVLDNSLDLSHQSIVTHIQSPTHCVVVDTDEECEAHEDTDKVEDFPNTKMDTSTMPCNNQETVIGVAGSSIEPITTNIHNISNSVAPLCSSLGALVSKKNSRLKL